MEKIARKITITDPTDQFYKLYEVIQKNKEKDGDVFYVEVEIKRKPKNKIYRESMEELLEQGADPDDIDDLIDENGMVIR